jgi:uridine phosphorylase
VPLRSLQIDGRPALIGIDPTKVGDYVFIFVRDPLCAYDDDPATQLASRLENAELAGKTGMFTTWTGTYKGARISAVSGGSGGGEAELCMFELLEYTNASTFLRVGGSGGTNEAVRPGDLVIAKGIVRDEGLSAAYVGPVWPAVCDPEVVIALAEAARALNVRYHIGLTRSVDSDLISGGRPSVRGYLRPENLNAVDECRRTGVLNGEREASAIVTMATLFGSVGALFAPSRITSQRAKSLRPGRGTIRPLTSHWKAWRSWQKWILNARPSVRRTGFLQCRRFVSRLVNTPADNLVIADADSIRFILNGVDIRLTDA